jgi:hypothetical protein
MIIKSGIFENYLEGNASLFTLGQTHPVTQWKTSRWDKQTHFGGWFVQCGEEKYLLSLPGAKHRFVGHQKKTLPSHYTTLASANLQGHLRSVESQSSRSPALC